MGTYHVRFRGGGRPATASCYPTLPSNSFLTWAWRRRCVGLCVGFPRAGDPVLRAEVERTGGENGSTRIHLGMSDRRALDWASEMLDQLTHFLNAIDAGDPEAAAQLPAGW